MINFNDYKFIKKSESELTQDEIINGIYRKLWDEKGYTTVYYLGAIAQLKAMVKGMKNSTLYSKRELLMMIAAMKNYPEVPDDITNLVNDILEEFDYKENNNE